MFIEGRDNKNSLKPAMWGESTREGFSEDTGKREDGKEGSSLLPPLACGGYRGVGNPLKNFAPLRYFVKGLQFAVASAFRFPV